MLLCCSERSNHNIRLECSGGHLVLGGYILEIEGTLFRRGLMASCYDDCLLIMPMEMLRSLTFLLVFLDTLCVIGGRVCSSPAWQNTETLHDTEALRRRRKMMIPCSVPVEPIHIDIAFCFVARR